MTDEDERKARRDSPEDRTEKVEEKVEGKLEEKMEEFRGEARERHPELEGGDGKEQAEPAEQAERSERSPERGERATGAEDRGHERVEDEGRDTQPDRAEKTETEDREPSRADESRDVEQREHEPKGSGEAHEHLGESEATKPAPPELKPEGEHREPRDEPEQHRMDEASERTSAEPEGSNAEKEREEAELERFRGEVAENHPEVQADERPEPAREAVEAGSPRQDDHEDRPDGPRNAAEAEARQDGGERQSDEEDARAVETADQPEPRVENQESHREEEQHGAEREKEQLQNTGRQEKDRDPNLDEPSENGRQLERVETDRESHPKSVEVSENSDSEISRRENPPVEAGADEVNDGSRVKEQEAQENPKTDNAESADRQPRIEDDGGVNVLPPDIESMSHPPPEKENKGKEQADSSDRRAVENLGGQPDAEKTEVKAVDVGSQQEGFPPVQGGRRQDIEITTSADGKLVPVQLEPVEKAEPLRYIASFEATALRRPEDGRTAFEINVESLERQSGVTFEKGKVYTVSGSIEYDFDFRKLYSVGESEKMVVFAPSRLADSIERGERYAVNITSVQEISRTDRHLGVFYENAYRDERNGSVKFDILRTSFEKRTGVHFEEGKTYRIAGTIGDVTDFELMHSRNEGKYLFVSVPPEARDMIASEQKYELKVLSIEERRTYTVHWTEAGVRLQLQKYALESVGIELEKLKGRAEQDRIVELTMRNLSHPGEAEKRLYSQVNPTEGAVMKLGRVGAKEGDTFELVRGRFYEKEDFLKDFAAHRGKETQNVELKMDGKKLAMEVDGRKFEISDHRLDVHALRVFMKARTEAFKYDLHFIYDASEGTITAKTVRGRTIESFSASETHGLEVKYAPRDKEIATITEPRLPQEAKWEMPQYHESVKLLGENQGIESPHWFEMDEALHRYIIDTRNSKEYSKRPELGTIGENLGSAVLTKLGWTEIERHPFETRRGPGPEWYKHGTDILFREPVTNQLYLFEFKCWRNSHTTTEKACKEVMGRQSDEKEHRKWGKISGAYIAVVILDGRDRVGELRIKRVW